MFSTALSFGLGPMVVQLFRPRGLCMISTKFYYLVLENDLTLRYDRYVI